MFSSSRSRLSFYSTNSSFLAFKSAYICSLSACWNSKSLSYSVFSSISTSILCSTFLYRKRSWSLSCTLYMLSLFSSSSFVTISANCFFCFYVFLELLSVDSLIKNLRSQTLHILPLSFFPSSII